MPTAPRVWTSEAFEAGTKYPTARVVDKDGNVCVQSDFATNGIVRVYDISSSTPSTLVLSNTVAISTLINNTLQSWDVDDVGWNFQTTITSNQVAWEGGHTYRVSTLLPHDTQGYIPVVHDIKIRALLSL